MPLNTGQQQQQYEQQQQQQQQQPASTQYPTLQAGCAMWG
jgi:hypothetical protein